MSESVEKYDQGREKTGPVIVDEQHQGGSLQFFLNQLQTALAGGHLRVTGLLSLVYSGVLFTEGIGVYLQKRWGELLMIFATSALIPFEIHHLFIKRSVAAIVVLAVNCFIVWFLYLVLRRERPQARLTAP